MNYFSFKNSRIVQSKKILMITVLMKKIRKK